MLFTDLLSIVSSVTLPLSSRFFFALLRREETIVRTQKNVIPIPRINRTSNRSVKTIGTTI